MRKSKEYFDNLSLKLNSMLEAKGFANALNSHSIHDLKILPCYFREVNENRKGFELRKDDRDYKVGDSVRLREFEDGKYTGNACIRVITYVLRDCSEYGLQDGVVLLSIKCLHEI